MEEADILPWLEFLDFRQILSEQIKPLHVAFRRTFAVAAIGFLQAALRRHRSRCHSHLLTILALPGYRYLSLLNGRRLLLGGGNNANRWPGRRRRESPAAGIFGFGEAGHVAEGAGPVALTMREPHQIR
jgi:hypothetical protein